VEPFNYSIKPIMYFSGVTKYKKMSTCILESGSDIKDLQLILTITCKEVKTFI
jgi:hypothetical protein